MKARMGDVEWETALVRKDGRCVVPLRDQVRKPAGLDEGDTVAIRLTPVGPVDDPRPRQPAPRPSVDRRDAGDGLPYRRLPSPTINSRSCPPTR